MKNDARQFQCEVVFNRGNNSPYLVNTFGEDDMDYLRTRIMTHRSVHSSVIDEKTSRYYESAKTMIDLLNIFRRMDSYAIFISEVEIIVQPDTEDEVGYARLTAPCHVTARQYTDCSHRYSVSTDMLIQMYYADYGKDAGFYYIRLIPMSDDATGPVSVGSLYLSDYILPEDAEKYSFLADYADEGMCFPVGLVLKYSENFDAPSNLEKQFEDAMREAISIPPSAQEQENMIYILKELSRAVNDLTRNLDRCTSKFLKSFPDQIAKFNDKELK